MGKGVSHGRTDDPHPTGAGDCGIQQLRRDQRLSRRAAGGLPQPRLFRGQPQNGQGGQGCAQQAERTGLNFLRKRRPGALMIKTPGPLFTMSL